MKKSFCLPIIIIIFLCFGNIVFAEEKPIVIKGIFIGMDINMAKNTIEQLLGKEWKITPIGDTASILTDYRFGNESIFGTGRNTGTFYPTYPTGSIIGDYGFAISRDNSYEGFISANKSTNKVTRISFSGYITDYIYSSSKIDAEIFLKQLRQSFQLPEFDWIAYGWTYTSPLEYTIIFMTNKRLDIKKDNIDKSKIDNQPKIKFD